MSSCVRLAAMMPARRAAAMTSPLGTVWSSITESVSSAITTCASARALRSVSSLAPTSTIVARPRASMWLNSVIRSSSDLRHGALVRQRLAASVVALARHGPLDRGAKLQRPIEQRAHIHLVAREEAGAQATVGGEAQAVAAPAEVLADAGDEADRAARPGHMPILRRAVPVRTLVRHQLVALLEALQDLARGHEAARAAKAVAAGDTTVERHELDEAHVHLALAREVDEPFELFFDALQQQGVDLDRREPGGESGIETGQRVGELAAATDAREARRVEAVEADVDAAQAGAAQVLGVSRQ